MFDFPALAVHQQHAIKLQTPPDQNAVYKKDSSPKGGRRRGYWRRSADDSTAVRPQHVTGGESVSRLATL